MFCFVYLVFNSGRSTVFRGRMRKVWQAWNVALRFSRYAHPVLSFYGFQLLYGVAQGGARHLEDVLAEEVAQQVGRHALAHLAQHPSHGFVHEVVGVLKVALGIAQAP